MKHKTAELEDALLDAAVAKAEGLTPSVGRRWFLAYPHSIWIGAPPEVCWVEGWRQASGAELYAPSLAWEQGGPIIERERIELSISERVQGWWANLHGEIRLVGVGAWGPTPLIAAMRAFVASKFGEEVELPG